MKKRNFTKILALLIALVMVIPCIPVVASAATTTVEYITPTLDTPGFADTNESYDSLDAWLEAIKDANGHYILDSRVDLYYFMQCGQETTNISTHTSYPRFNGATFKLGADIVWNEGVATATGFEPAVSQNGTAYIWSPYHCYTSTSSHNYWGFRGTFDGDGHTISGIVLKGTTNLGFFMRTGDGAKIKNVKFTDTYVSGTRHLSALVAQPCGNLEITNVGIDCDIVGNDFIGGLVGRPAYDATGKTITISNTSVSGSMSATAGNNNNTVGGFIGSNRTYTVSITKSVSYVDVKGTKYVSGFIGAAMHNVSMTDCQFMGTAGLSDGTTATNIRWVGAFACFVDLDGTKAYATNSTSKPETNYEFNLTNCRQVRSGGASYSLAMETKTPWYTLTVDDGYEAGPKVIDCSGLKESEGSELNATKALEAACRRFYVVPGTDDIPVAIEGVQRDSNGNARFIASIKDDANIKAVGFAVVKLSAYVSKVEWMNGAQAKVEQIQAVKKCDAAYTSILSDYGLTEVAASAYGAEYLVGLELAVPSDATETLLIRTYYVTADTGETVYGGYVAATFANGILTAFVDLG